MDSCEDMTIAIDLLLSRPSVSTHMIAKAVRITPRGVLTHQTDIAPHPRGAIGRVNQAEFIRLQSHRCIQRRCEMAGLGRKAPVGSCLLFQKTQKLRMSVSKHFRL